MLSFFSRRKASPISSNTATGFFKPESPDGLLSTSRRRQLIENIWQRTSLPREQFDTLYMQAFKSYAALVQHLPASENHHHAYHGGMLDHGLEIVAYAMEHGLVELKVNPLKETRVIPTKRPKKTIKTDAIVRARNWLNILVQEERATEKRAEITPAWFWLAVFEMFYYTGIRLNALICLRYADIDIGERLIRVRGETEKTHREFMIPIPDGLMPHLKLLMEIAHKVGFAPTDQIFNVNRFSGHYSRSQMNSDQVEAMYKKLTAMTGVRMTPHRFRHTIASEMMRQPERNIHITKSLLNHSNIATTMEYIEPDYDVMREVMNERGKRPAKINYLAKSDAANQENARTSKKAPVKNLTQNSPRITPTPHLDSASGSTRVPATAANVHPQMKTDEMHRRGERAKNAHSNRTETYRADPVPIDQTDLFGDLADPLMGRALAPGDMSAEYLARRLDEFSLWLREAASGRLVMGPTSVGTSIPSGPNEQKANLTPVCIQASTWSSRTG